MIKVITINPVVIPTLVIKSLSVNFFMWFSICTCFAIFVVLLDWATVTIDPAEERNAVIEAFPNRLSAFL